MLRLFYKERLFLLYIPFCDGQAAIAHEEDGSLSVQDVNVALVERPLELGSISGEVHDGTTLGVGAVVALIPHHEVAPQGTCQPTNYSFHFTVALPSCR